MDILDAYKTLCMLMTAAKLKFIAINYIQNLHSQQLINMKFVCCSHIQILCLPPQNPPRGSNRAIVQVMEKQIIIETATMAAYCSSVHGLS